MTFYHLPVEPKTDRLWTLEGDGTDPKVFEWHYNAGSHFWWSGQASCRWVDLLTRGAVSDHHPDLPDGAPLPWSWDEEQGVLDADGRPVDTRPEHEAAGFIVRAANAYAERLGGTSR
jgi:hypothetical protein